LTQQFHWTTNGSEGFFQILVVHKGAKYNT
jgi:hypothetical protein